MCIVAYLLLLQAQPPIEGSPQWVIRELSIAVQQNVEWRYLFPSFADADRNGGTDLILWGFKPNFDSVLRFSTGGPPMHSAASVLGQNLGEPFRFHFGGGQLLRSGNDVHLIGMDSGGLAWPLQDSFLLFWNPATRMVVDRLPAPVPPQPWLPKLTRWGYNGMSQGDMDGDGYDDFATIAMDETRSWLISLVVDGRTRTYRWVNYIQEQIVGYDELCPAPFPNAGQDIDFDGVNDLYFAYVPSSNYFITRLCAISGRDGSRIWSKHYTKAQIPTGSRVTVVGDLNSDGYHDLLDASLPVQGLPGSYPGYAGHVRAISGLDGSILWERRGLDYDPFYQPGATYLEVQLHSPEYGPGKFPDVNFDGVPDLLMKLGLAWHPGHTYPLEHMAILSGKDGAPLSMEPLERSMDPFIPGELVRSDAPKNIGDWDGDGWPELWMPSTALPSYQRVISIFGRETLHLPDEAVEGDLVRARLWIPTGAGKEFHILLSDVFDNDGQSFHAGTWDTHLMDGPLLRASMASPSLRGTLDAEGKASLQFEVPTTWSLAGKDLYAVAIVHDPSKPDGVLVKSSLATVHVLP